MLGVVGWVVDYCWVCFVDLVVVLDLLLECIYGLYGFVWWVNGL